MKYRQTILQASLIFITLVVLVGLIATAVYFYLFDKDLSIRKNGLNTTTTTVSVVKGSTSLDLVEADYKAGKIDYETYLINGVKAVFGDHSLPANYASDVDLFEPGDLLYQVKKNYDKLSDKAKQTLIPYFKRPDDPASYLSKLYNGELAVERSFFRIVDIAKATERPAYSKFLVTADNKIKIWYPEKTVKQGATEKKVALYESAAKQIINDLNTNQAYNKFKKILVNNDPPSDGIKGGDNKIDFYLVSSDHPELEFVESNFKASGVVINDGVGTTGNSDKSGFALIDASLPIKALTATVVHELFHIFQGSFNFEYYGDKDAWWLEATAVWAESYIYPSLNSEHDKLNNYFANPEITLTKFDRNHEYGAYIFPYYLTQVYGDKIITDVFAQNGLLNLSALDSIKVEIISYKGVFDEFALWNYNKDAAKLYKDQGGFPSNSTEAAVSSQQVYTKGNRTTNLTIGELDSLSSRLVKVMISSKDPKGRKINKAKFDISSFTSQSYDTGVRAVIYTRDGKSYLEDWNSKTGRTFDFSQGGQEDAMMVVLVFSNVSYKNKIKPSNITIESVAEEEKKENFVLTSFDKRSYTMDPCTPDEAGVVSCTIGGKKLPVLKMEYIFNATGKYVGPGAVPEYTKIYPYMGKWEMSYNYQKILINSGETETHTGQVTFDLSEAYNEIINFGKNPGAFQINVVSSSNNGWSLSGHYGMMTTESIKKDSTVFELNFYDWNYNHVKSVTIDMSNVKLYIKKS